MRDTPTERHDGTMTMPPQPPHESNDDARARARAQRAELERALHYPWRTTPESLLQCEVASGVWWLRLPLPFALDHINVWLLQDDPVAGTASHSYCLVDTGVCNDATKAVWERWLHELGAPLGRLLLTHCHPDHIGMAHWLCERFGLIPHISASEFLLALTLSQRTDGGSAAMLEHFHRNGLMDAMGEEGLARIRARGELYPRLVPQAPRRLQRLQDGQHLRIGGHEWQVIVGHGHSPEHASLYRATDHVLISGDMVLPRITTNISVWAIEPLADPLTLYERSLDAFAHLPQDTLVLPSHGLPFRGLATRIQQLRDHHAERLSRLEHLLRQATQPQSAAALTPQLFERTLDEHQFTFALGETLAFLHALWYQGRAQLITDAAGVRRFVASA